MLNLNSELKIATWNVRGMCNKDMQKEVKKFIMEEKLSVCATLETHLKPNQINKVSEFVFGRWQCINNSQESKRGCRILVGWNPEDVHLMMIHSCSQAILCRIEIVSCKIKFFCCFVYAANTGRERRELWKTLKRYKSIVNDDPWALMGDWNVSLNIEDHSEGGSCKTPDMNEFQECLDSIETEDMNCTGTHFTWIQSRLNPNNGILKKIDRVLSNLRDGKWVF